MEYVFILVKPENSKNIGAAARALKTMGHSDLRIVDPGEDHLNGAAKALAHGSFDILENARRFSSLEDASKDCDFVIGTTARHRKTKLRYFDVNELPSMIASKGNLINKTAVVFGGETSGLSNEDLLFCDVAASVPLATTNPSINLAQAVMIFSYTLSQLEEMRIQDRRIDIDKASELEYSTLKQGVWDLIDKIDFPKKETVKRHFASAITRLGHDDLYLLHNLRKRIARKIEQLEKQIDER